MVLNSVSYIWILLQTQHETHGRTLWNAGLLVAGCCAPNLEFIFRFPRKTSNHISRVSTRLPGRIEHWNKQGPWCHLHDWARAVNQVIKNMDGHFIILTNKSKWQWRMKTSIMVVPMNWRNPLKVSLRRALLSSRRPLM